MFQAADDGGVALVIALVREEPLQRRLNHIGLENTGTVTKHLQLHMKVA